MGAIWLAAGLGTELFPSADVGQISMQVRFESGTRIEKTEEEVRSIEEVIKSEIGKELQITVSNIGVLNDWPAAYTPNSGSQDAFINIQLTGEHETSSAEYVRRLRNVFREHFPGVQFAFNTGGLITAALNFGLPSPIDIQVTGNDLFVANDSTPNFLYHNDGRGIFKEVALGGSLSFGHVVDVLGQPTSGKLLFQNSRRSFFSKLDQASPRSHGFRGGLEHANHA